MTPAVPPPPPPGFRRVPHIIPLDVGGNEPEPPHDIDAGCFCLPTNDDGVMVHHSGDGREFGEGNQLWTTACQLVPVA